MCGSDDEFGKSTELWVVRGLPPICAFGPKKVSLAGLKREVGMETALLDGGQETTDAPLFQCTLSRGAPQEIDKGSPLLERVLCNAAVEAEAKRSREPLSVTQC